MLWTTWLHNLYIFDTINAAIVVAMQGGRPQALMNVYSHFVWGSWYLIDIVQGHGTNPHGALMLWTTWWRNLYIFDTINAAIVVAVQGGRPQALENWSLLIMSQGTEWGNNCLHA